MSIIKAPQIYINGSTNAFGGYVYSADFNHEYGQTPSSLTISVISNSRNYLPVKLSTNIPYTVKFDDEITLKMYAVDWTITDGTEGKVLNVEMVDGRFKMSKIWVVLKDFPCGRENPNIMFVGTLFDPSANQTNPNNATPIGTSPALNSVTKPTDGSQLFLSYTYDELRAKSPIKLPAIPNFTPLLRLNTEGTLAEIFSEFCTAYGFTWYWDYNNEVPILLDLRKDVSLDSTLPTQLQTAPCRRSMSYGESIRDIEAQGVIFYNNSTTQDSSQSGPIFPVYSVFGNIDFLSFPIADKADIEAAEFAVWGEEIYIAYLFDKYQGDLDSVFKILGYDVVNSNDFQKMTTDQQDAVTRYSEKDSFLETVRMVRCKPKNQQNSPKSAHFRMADSIKAGQVGWMFTPYPITASSYQLTEISPKTPISQVPGIGNFLKTDITAFDSFNTVETVQDRTTNHLYVVNFPKLKFTFNNFGAIDPTAASTNSFAPATLQQRYVQLSDGKSFDPDADEGDVFFLVWGSPNQAPTPRVDGIIGYVFSDSPSPLSNNSALAASYSSKYKNFLCRIPILNDITTSFRIISLTNDGIVSPAEALVNSAIIPTAPHQNFSIDVYGINTGLNLTPQKGLDSFRVSMGDNGYQTTYVLSSKKRIPLDNKIAKQIYI